MTGPVVCWPVDATVWRCVDGDCVVFLGVVDGTTREAFDAVDATRGTSTALRSLRAETPRWWRRQVACDLLRRRHLDSCRCGPVTVADVPLGRRGTATAATAAVVDVLVRHVAAAEGTEPGWCGDCVADPVRHRQALVDGVVDLAGQLARTVLAART